MTDSFLHIAEIVVLGGAVWFARGAILSHHKIEKQRNSIAQMTRFFLDNELVTASRLLARIDGDSEDSVEIYAYAKKRDTDERKAIQTLLNFLRGGRRRN